MTTRRSDGKTALDLAEKEEKVKEDITKASLLHLDSRYGTVFFIFVPSQTCACNILVACCELSHCEMKLAISSRNDTMFNCSISYIALLSLMNALNYFICSLLKLCSLEAVTISKDNSISVVQKGGSGSRISVYFLRSSLYRYHIRRTVCSSTMNVSKSPSAK